MDYNSLLRQDGPKADAAFKTLLGPVPPQMTFERQGPSGTKLTYVKHQDVTLLMQKAFGPFWNFDVLETGTCKEMIPRRNGEDVEKWTAWARGKLTLFMQLDNGDVLPLTWTAVGNFDNVRKMPDASGRSSAASRSICKAVALALGFGHEFYEPTDVIILNPRAIWNMLLEHAAENGVGHDTVEAAIKSCGIPQSEWVDRYDELCAIVDKLEGNVFDEDSIVKEDPTPQAINPAKTETTAAGPFSEITTAAPSGADATETVEDPVVQAAIEELGATVVGEPDWGWGEFFLHCKDELGIASPTEANKELDKMYGKGQRPKSKREMFQELKVKLGKADDTTSQDTSSKGEEQSFF